MPAKADFSRLKSVDKKIMSGVFIDALCPDFKFGIAVKPLIAYTDISRVLATQAELTETYVTGKWSDETKQREVTPLITPELKLFTTDETTCSLVAQLLHQQSDVDEAGQPSAIYDTYELFCVSQDAPDAFQAAINLTNVCTNAMREKKGVTPSVTPKAETTTETTTPISSPSETSGTEPVSEALSTIPVSTPTS